MHTKGYATPDTKAAVERALLLIEKPKRWENLPTIRCCCFRCFTVFWVANYVAIQWRRAAGACGAVPGTSREATGTPAPLMIGHRLMGISLLQTGDIVEGAEALRQAIALYDPAEHRPLATRFGDVGVCILSYRSWTFGRLVIPEAALADIDHALRDAREIGHAATLMFALGNRYCPTSSAGIMRQQTRSR